MKNHKNKQERFPHLKRKLMAALCMLLISSILMATTSYAWLVLSIAPEVTGMSVNVGANGALEIALLNKETHGDLSKISSMGGSLANRDPKANNAWGNTLDLSYEDYGLQELVLWPSRLNISEQAEGYVISGGVLSVPTYGYDGRIIDLTENTLTGVYDDKNFSTVLGGEQDYGVRVVGTADTLTPQNAALAQAKSNIFTYMNSANALAAGSLKENTGLMNIMMDRGGSYGDEDLAVLQDLIAELQESLDYIDLALRQGMVAVAASKISDVNAFEAAKNKIQDGTKSLSTIMSELSDDYDVDNDFSDWILKFEATRADLNAAQNACELSGGSYTWEDFKQPLNYIMNMNGVYINEDKFEDFDTSKVQELLSKGVTITMAPGSGVYADIADFTGDIASWATYVVRIEIKTLTDQNPVHLQALYAAVSQLEAADGSGAGETEVELTTTFGYVVDMAFRTNAAVSDLLLQTTPAQRVSDDSDEARTMGGGSYMEFTTDDESFTVDKMLELMDAIRVAFMDDQGNVLGIAKLNTSNRELNEEKVKAPLYLYTFHIDEEDGSLKMDERQKENNVLTALEQNVAKAVSVVVWLDGDLVDNTKVSATEETSLKGVLNLQFASSADLISAGDSAMMDVSANKEDLEAALIAEKSTYDNGQAQYTTISWKAYSEAYEYASAVVADAGANEKQVYHAAKNLVAAKQQLDIVSHDALQTKIEEIRQRMGETTDLARYVMKAEDGSYYTLEEYTEEEAAAKVGEVYRVDYTKNLQDEGEGIMTPIYTDESWSALASALYDAEAVDMNPNATDPQLDVALTALATAYDALARKIFYLPYDYEGDLFYFAISNEEDTYGKWYYADFTRVVSDLQILKLDAKAVPVEIAQLITSEYVNVNSPVSTAYVELLKEIYPALKDEVITGLTWASLDGTYFSEIMGAKHEAVLDQLVTKAKALNAEAAAATIEGYTAVDVANAEAILTKYDGRSYDNAENYVTAADAEAEIASLQSAVAAAEATIKEATEKVDNSLMSADQRILLTEAVASAKTVEGYEDTTKADLDALRTAVSDADSLLASAGAVTAVEADAKLAALNNQLEANGKAKVTVANTIKHPIPVGSEVYEIVNVAEMAGIEFLVAGKTGTTNVSVVGVTRGGVVIKICKEVTVYTPATGAKVNDEAGEVSTTLTMNVGDTMNLAALLDYDVANIQNLEDQISLGNITELGDSQYEVVVKETVKEYLWSTSENEFVTVAGINLEECTIRAAAVGTTVITVSITTHQGNTYLANVTVTVNEATP